jgi:opacity protein-like surface antigen
LRSLCLVVVLAMTATAIASAQDLNQEGENEVAGTFGHTFVSDQGVPNSGLANSIINHGAGYSFEANYARILRSYDWADFAVEVPAVFNPDEDLHYFTNQVPQQYSSIFITPAARLRLFPEVAFSPWVSFGGGLGHFQASSSLVFGGNNTGNRGETTGVLQGGVGLDVHIPGPIQRLKIRVEARDDWSGTPPINVNTGKTRQHNYYVAGGLVYKF